MDTELYLWQKECIQAWFDNQHHGIVNVVTGAGKTIMALSAVQQLQKRQTLPLRVKIVVPTTSLMTQWASSILNYFGDEIVSRTDIGYYGGACKDSGSRKYMIYVINSARYSLARHILEEINQGFCVLLIADECHHYCSVENRKIFDFIPLISNLSDRYFSMGLSATPYTFLYDQVLVPALGKEIYKYTFADAAQKQTISDYVLFHVALSFNPEEMNEYIELSDRIQINLAKLLISCPYLKKYQGHQFFAALKKISLDSNLPSAALASTVLNLSYKRKALVCTAEARFHCVCKLVEVLEQKSKIIIFGERIEQADLVYQQLSEKYPNQVGRYHSKMEKQAKKNALTRFRDGELRILVSCKALDEGFDVPAASVGIILSSTSVLRQRIQRLGRILRRQDEKSISCLYYFYIADSSEENTFFLEPPEGSPICELSYNTLEDNFIHPAYEKLAAHVLHHASLKKTDKELLLELRKCMEEGLVRPDWLIDAKILQEKVLSARTTKERNYWLCMKHISIAHFSDV